MTKTPFSHHPLFRINTYTFWGAVLWTLIIASSLAWNIHYTERQTLAKADLIARLAFDRDATFRSWVTHHGGVYVPVTPTTPSNPHLDVPDKDVSTARGNPLTLMNPAYVMRQFYEQVDKTGGIKGHITSLRPLRPENKPDFWEEEALKAFEGGLKEKTVIQTIDGNEYVRFMKPFVTAAGCLKCHAAQGYREGDIRGGVSVSVPMAPLRVLERSNTIMLSQIHALLWALGLVGIFIFGLGILKSERNRLLAEDKLTNQMTFLETLIDTMPNPFFYKDIQGRYLGCNLAFEEFYGRSREEIIGKSVYDMAPAEIADTYAQKDQELFERPGKQTYEWKVQRADGSIREVVFNKASFEDSGGATAGLVGTIIDITDRKDTEVALKDSEARFRQLADATFEGILIHDGGEILDFNQALGEMLGYDRNEVIGHNVFDFIPPGAREEALRQMGSSHERPFELLLMRKNGVPLTVEISGKDTSYRGRQARVVALRDITERKAMEDLYRTLAESSHAGIYIVQDGKFCFGNSNMAIYAGYSLAEMIGMEASVIVHPEDTESAKQNALDMLKGHRKDPYEFRIISKYGDIRWIMETVTSIQYRGRRAVLGNSMDVTQRKRIEEDLRRTARQLQETRNMLIQSEKMATAGQLATGVAHEILNPVNILSMRLQLLGQLERLSDTGKDTLSICKHQIDRIVKIINDLDQLTHAVPSLKAPCDLNGMIHQCLAVVAERLKRESILINLHVDEDLPKLALDRGRLEQVLLILIGNAMDAMEGRDNKEIVITTETRTNAQGGKSIRATLSDRGHGIKEENLQRIFDPFFTTRAPGKGTGLGLSIAYGIIEDHRGRIWAENNEWGGAAFHIELPLVV